MTRRLLLPVIGTVLLLGTSAAGAPTWGAPVQISTGDRALGPELALNVSGAGLVVWDQEVGSDCPTSPAALSCIHIVEAAARARGAALWQTPVEVARPGVGSRPGAAIDANGNAAIVWVHDIGRDRVLQATYRRGSSGTWPEPNDLSEPSLEIRNHAIALDAAGNAVAVWAERAVDAFAVFVEVRAAASGAWEAPVRLSAAARDVTGGPVVAITPSGRAVVAWIEGNDVLRAARGDAAIGAWESPLTLSAPTADGGPQIAINAAGDTAVVWARGNSGNLRAVEAVFRRREGNWTEPFELGTVRSTAVEELQVGVDDAGNALAMWVGLAGVQAAARPTATGVWSPPALVSVTSLAASGARLAVDAAGNAVAVWVDGATRVVQAAIRPGASGKWQTQIVVSESGAFEPRVTMDAAGSAVAIWNRSSSQRVVVESADLGGSGPVLARLAVPKRAVIAGARVRLSVQPVPWVAPLAGEPRWRFGDGSSATGARVAHAYARTGRYSVSVSQTDSAHEVSTATATIAVIGARVRNRRPPSIRGTPRVGNTLTCLRGLWSGSPPIRYTFSWRRDGRLIPGATQRRHRLGQPDAGSLIVCEVKATNPAGSAHATSAVVGVKR